MRWQDLEDLAQWWILRRFQISFPCSWLDRRRRRKRSDWVFFSCSSSMLWLIVPLLYWYTDEKALSLTCISPNAEAKGPWTYVEWGWEIEENQKWTRWREFTVVVCCVCVSPDDLLLFSAHVEHFTWTQQGWKPDLLLFFSFILSLPSSSLGFWQNSMRIFSLSQHMCQRLRPITAWNSQGLFTKEDVGCNVVSF